MPVKLITKEVVVHGNIHDECHIQPAVNAVVVLRGRTHDECHEVALRKFIVIVHGNLHDECHRNTPPQLAWGNKW